MRSNPRRAGLGLLLLAACSVTGCDSTRTDPTPHPTPTASASQPAAASQPASAPAASQPTTQPADTQPALPELPPYVVIVEVFDPGTRSSLTARVDPHNRLVLETRNVRRVRIFRDKTTLDLTRSIALQLDGQGIEWLSRSRVEEFERSVNGDWTPVPPPAERTGAQPP